MPSNKGTSAISNNTPDSNGTAAGVVAPDAKRAKSPSDDKQESLPVEAAAATASPAPISSSTEENLSSAVKDAQEAEASMQKVMDLTVALMKDKDVKVAQRAATAAGHLCAGQPVKAVLDPALEGLFALGFNKNEDVLFTVGEALCFAFGGIVLLSSFLHLSYHRPSCHCIGSCEQINRQ